METILELLKSKTQKDFDEMYKKFNENILFRFGYDAEDIYKKQKKLAIIENIQQSLKNATALDTPVTKEQIIKYLEEKVLSSTKLMDRSTNQVAALCSLWDKEVMLDLIEFFKWESQFM